MINFNSIVTQRLFGEEESWKVNSLQWQKGYFVKAMDYERSLKNLIRGGEECIQVSPKGY